MTPSPGLKSMPSMSAMKAPRSACIRASLLLGPAAVWQNDWMVGDAKRRVASSSTSCWVILPVVSWLNTMCASGSA